MQQVEGGSESRFCLARHTMRWPANGYTHRDIILEVGPTSPTLRNLRSIRLPLATIRHQLSTPPPISGRPPSGHQMYAMFTLGGGATMNLVP